METVKQMDTALQRRSKLKANAGTTISDSDKISLQLLLDVRAYGRGIESLGTQFVLPSYAVRVYIYVYICIEMYRYIYVYALV
jgi:hypothetical protein